ncbi:hypothetical protein MCEZE10_01674 [Sphingomonadaceae bacterium]|uniref:hypothetical protein n=1 Tax=Sphingorhabdus sp. TaxID=1902408 RepID=UPI00273D3D6C|nr:hypothetical protein [Sphingorhabdus sp.]MCF8493053.1 hypothetical protein [Sphingomonadaceae bacterium]MCF8498598.1 hypothetical protein [Sphingomonadaceae bacterium]MDP4756993.1 hypothetical protein [Sphingorhabdus sp.]MDP4874129.1 hypothetical protein [Sphingorhabdus sp.]MDP4927793.1 hypothetical protein [Sphingorhabdus sp.]
MTAELLKLGGSIAAILFIAWFARFLRLGGDVRIRSEEQAREIANETCCGFDPVEIAIDKAGIAALLRDAEGRHLLVRRHGVQWAGRLLDRHNDSRLDKNFLTVGTGEKTFGSVTLNLGSQASHWAAGLRNLKI